MIRKNLKLLIVTTIVILLPMLAGILLWNKLPELMPIHWNSSWEVDGWAGKPFAVIGMPLLLAAIHWICILVTLSDPKRANHSGKMLVLVFWLIPAISVLMIGLSYSAAMGKEIKLDLIVPVFLGLVFAAIGNYMPKAQQNYTIGIKLPWTLHSEENWNRTHRMAGRLWLICGIAIMLTGFLGLMAAVLPIAILMVLVPMVYSYILYRKGI